MQVNVTVTLDASPALLAALAALAQSFKQPEPAVKAEQVRETKKKSADAVRAQIDAKVEPVEVIEAQLEAVGALEPSQNGQALTMEKLRAIAVPKSKAGHRDTIKRWLSARAYASLQDLREEDFGAFHEFINSL